MTDGMFTKNKDKQYKYEVWEETTTTSTVKEHIIIQAASSKNDSTNNSLRSSTSSLVSAISIVLVALTVLLSSLTSYCLVQKYRRKRADDTEIEFLTGDELLYFHTPSPHLRSHRGQNPEPEVDDNMRSF
ncbi:hypothetical protein M8J75_009550 [Diaphorina citri]|nr:hypothetical protein M8J75_009550 [Diaphorina citri]